MVKVTKNGYQKRNGVRLKKRGNMLVPLVKSEKHGLTIVSLERKKPNDIPDTPLITYTKVKAGQVFLTFWDISLGGLCSGTR